MMAKIAIALTVLLASVLSIPVIAKPLAWPDGKQAAVVLTYDDALTSQLDIAIPALDAAGLKGTFFLSGLRADQVGRWRAAFQSPLSALWPGGGMSCAKASGAASAIAVRAAMVNFMGVSLVVVRD